MWFLVMATLWLLGFICFLLNEPLQQKNETLKFLAITFRYASHVAFGFALARWV